MDLENIFRGIGKRMLADFDDISSEVTHRGAKGRIRERRIVTDYLDKYLPGNIGIGAGEVVSADGQVSPEIDIVMYDKLATPYLLRDECYQIFPAECVYGVVEVKSYLSQRELGDAARKLQKIKELPKVAFEPQSGPIIRATRLYGRELSCFPVIGFVVAYESPELAGLADHLNTAQNALRPEQRIDSVWVLKRGMIVPVSLETKKIEFTPTPKTAYVPIESANPLLLLTLHLQTLMTGAWMTPFRIKHYLDTANYGEIKNYTFPAGSINAELLPVLIKQAAANIVEAQNSPEGSSSQ
jgi:uncharacterized protein DUF6602